MRVLRKGSGQKGWSETFFCRGTGNGGGGCGAMLLVEQDDVFQTRKGRYDGTTEHYNTFLCWECGRPNDIPSVPFQPREMTEAEREKLR